MLPSNSASDPPSETGTDLQGHLAHKKMPPTLGPPQDPRHRPTVGSQGEAVSHSEVPLYMFRCCSSTPFSGVEAKLDSKDTRHPQGVPRHIAEGRLLTERLREN